jgi:hypothetical protein
MFWTCIIFYVCFDRAVGCIFGECFGPALYFMFVLTGLFVVYLGNVLDVYDILCLF